ncbi:hypothetical protein MRX96_010878 [Rhipicephalus microplus]
MTKCSWATWNESEAASVRVPYGLRERALQVLSNATQEPGATNETYITALQTTAAFHLIRTMDELMEVEAVAASYNPPPEILREIKDEIVMNDHGLFGAWLH